MSGRGERGRGDVKKGARQNENKEEKPQRKTDTKGKKKTTDRLVSLQTSNPSMFQKLIRSQPQKRLLLEALHQEITTKRRDSRGKGRTVVLDDAKKGGPGKG